MFALRKHSGRGFWTDVQNGFRRAGWILLFFFWGILALTGLACALAESTRFPPLAGWLMLVLAMVIAIVTMDRWAKVLPGLFGYGVLNGLIMATTGHLVNDSSIRVARGTAVAMTLLGLASAILANTIASRKLTIFDRVALAGVVSSLLAGIAIPSLTIVSFCLMTFFLAAAWGVDRFGTGGRGAGQPLHGRLSSFPVPRTRHQR